MASDGPTTTGTTALLKNVGDSRSIPTNESIYSKNRGCNPKKLFVLCITIVALALAIAFIVYASTDKSSESESGSEDDNGLNNSTSVSPSIPPSINPTRIPSLSPTFLPSFSPSFSPTMQSNRTTITPTDPNEENSFFTRIVDELDNLESYQKGLTITSICVVFVLCLVCCYKKCCGGNLKNQSLKVEMTDPKDDYTGLEHQV